MLPLEKGEVQSDDDGGGAALTLDGAALVRGCGCCSGDTADVGDTAEAAPMPTDPTDGCLRCVGTTSSSSNSADEPNTRGGGDTDLCDDTVEAGRPITPPIGPTLFAVGLGLVGCEPELDEEA